MEEESEVKCLFDIEEDSNICECYFEQIKDDSSNVSDSQDIQFNVVTRTENYLKSHRIPELIRFLFTKIVSEAPAKPVEFLEKVLDDCMLFRAGHGPAPGVYEDRHLEAVIKSFDPGQRGWLSAGQVRRLYTTVGFIVESIEDERVPVKNVLEDLKYLQEQSLVELLSAGTASDCNQ